MYALMSSLQDNHSHGRCMIAPAAGESGFFFCNAGRDPVSFCTAQADGRLTWKQMWMLVMVICSRLSSMADRCDRNDHAKPLPSDADRRARRALASGPGEPHQVPGCQLSLLGCLGPTSSNAQSELTRSFLTSNPKLKPKRCWADVALCSVHASFQIRVSTKSQPASGQVLFPFLLLAVAGAQPDIGHLHHHGLALQRSPGHLRLQAHGIFHSSQFLACAAVAYALERVSACARFMAAVLTRQACLSDLRGFAAHQGCM